ncbi:GTP-binding protein REM 1 [Halotydeus destructor]|nr:GTP-binding protein REM 1 [Halotydeus destructor]
MSLSSRRNSTATLPPSPTSSQLPTTPTGKIMFGLPTPRARSKGSLSSNGSNSKKLQPMRRCQSMRYTGSKMTVTGSGPLTSASFRSRRVSSSNSIEHQKWNEEFIKYYQYKTDKVDPVSLLSLTIVDDPYEHKDHVSRVIVLGDTGCGKSSLIACFQNHLDEQKVSSGSRQRQAHNDHQRLTIHFREFDCFEQLLDMNCSMGKMYKPSAYVVMYSVNDRESFEQAKELIEELHKWADEANPLILVANKTDLVRSRTFPSRVRVVNLCCELFSCVISSTNSNYKSSLFIEGRQVAISKNCKYMEISCAISLNIDFLLAGIGAQINLKNNRQSQGTGNRKLNIFHRLLRRAALNKSKSCDNLNVL